MISLIMYEEACPPPLLQFRELKDAWIHLQLRGATPPTKQEAPPPQSPPASCPEPGPGELLSIKNQPLNEKQPSVLNRSGTMNADKGINEIFRNNLWKI